MLTASRSFEAIALCEVDHLLLFFVFFFHHIRPPGWNCTGVEWGLFLPRFAQNVIWSSAPLPPLFTRSNILTKGNLEKFTIFEKIIYIFSLHGVSILFFPSNASLESTSSARWPEQIHFFLLSSYMRGCGVEQHKLRMRSSSVEKRNNMHDSSVAAQFDQLRFVINYSKSYIRISKLNVPCSNALPQAKGVINEMFGGNVLIMKWMLFRDSQHIVQGFHLN